MKKILAVLTALVFVFSMATMASAAGSPSGDKTYKVTITTNKKDSAKPSYKSVKNGDTVELTADEDTDEYAFARWEITGDYEIISGDLESADLVIKPLGDVTVKAVYVDNKEDQKEDGPNADDPGKKNDSPKSPKTGDVWFLYLGGIFAASVVVAGTAKKLAK